MSPKNYINEYIQYLINKRLSNSKITICVVIWNIHYFENVLLGIFNIGICIILNIFNMVSLII